MEAKMRGKMEIDKEACLLLLCASLYFYYWVKSVCKIPHFSMEGRKCPSPPKPKRKTRQPAKACL